ncbi:HIR complex subunit [Ceratobasidium sp. 370]|nr:HIR complex subunit [Ceratobasidium sp. 370]
MRLVKPAWIKHEDAINKKRLPIFTVHVHPDGSRVATGGLDAKVRIWATKPIIRKDAEETATNKSLCTLGMHSGPVLVVRWSGSGKWLASGSDDTIVMIWDLDPHGGGRVFGSDEVNIEGWKALKRLPGHESDVTDLAWAPEDRYLASVGLDSKVIIWSGYNLEPLIKLDRHQGFVKGVTWDPVGQFLATQSDDKSVKVWRTTDWGLEATITKPFEDSPGSTFFRRLSWSPDGAHITASNAMNNNGYVFVAAVIERNQWKSDINLVGHENTVEVAGEYLKKFGFEARNAEIRMEQQREKEAYERAQQQQSLASATNGVTSVPHNVPTQQQVTITKDGRRRIKPNLIGHLSSSGTALLAPSTAIPTSIPISITVASATAAPTSASANLSIAEAFATAPMLPFVGADADGDVDMSVPIDAWGSGTKLNLKPRTLGGDRKREPVGPVRELRPAAGEDKGVVVGARVLQVPSIKSSLSCRVEGSDKDADTVEIKNSDDPEKPTEINYFRKTETNWLDYLPGTATHVVANMTFVAVALEDGAINFYTNTGRRAMATVMLDSPCAHLEAVKSFLLAISATGMVYSWNVRTPTALFAPVSILPLLSDNVSIDSVQLRTNGSHLIILSSAIAVSYEPTLMAWTRVSEPRWADGSDAWTGRQRGPSSGRGVLANMETTLTEMRGPDGDTSAIPRHLESRLGAAKLLDSPAEYKQAVLLYAKRLADEGFRAKAEELIKELCGPLYWKPGREERWQPTVLTLNKRDLLKDVLGIFGRSKTLAKLGQDYQELLKRANEKDDY